MIRPSIHLMSTNLIHVCRTFKIRSSNTCKCLYLSWWCCTYLLIEIFQTHFQSFLFVFQGSGIIFQVTSTLQAISTKLYWRFWHFLQRSSKIPTRIIHCLPKSWNWNLIDVFRRCMEVWGCRMCKVVRESNRRYINLWPLCRRINKTRPLLNIGLIAFHRQKIFTPFLHSFVTSPFEDPIQSSWNLSTVSNTDLYVILQPIAFSPFELNFQHPCFVRVYCC